jgi:hypothetical protein
MEALVSPPRNIRRSTADRIGFNDLLILLPFSLHFAEAPNASLWFFRMTNLLATTNESSESCGSWILRLAQPLEVAG